MILRHYPTPSNSLELGYAEDEGKELRA
jgi:hypothetical protein